MIAKGDGHLDAALGQIAHELFVIALFEVQGDHRMPLGEFEHQRGHETRRKRREAAHGDIAALDVAQRFRRLRELFGVLQEQPRSLDQPLPGRRECHALGVMADEDRDAEHLLKLGDCR